MCSRGCCSPIDPAIFNQPGGTKVPNQNPCKEIRVGEHDEEGGCACEKCECEESGSSSRCCAKAKKVEYGGICRYCNLYDEYPVVGSDGKVCCGMCATKERRD